MTKDIAPTASAPVSGVVDALRHASLLKPGHRSPGSASGAAVAGPGTARHGQSASLVSASRALDRAVEAAARENFAAREISVTSFKDEASGRYVHRITDLESGEVLLQSPPDELLRFFASGRELMDRPFVDLDV